MKNYNPLNFLIIPCFLIVSLVGCDNQKGNKLSEEDRKEILQVMEAQEKCWNAGDVECFMEGYHPSDSLRFIGKSGITYGWEKTLQNYKKGYPDKKTMGKLTFKVISLETLGNNKALLIGNWELQRNENPVGGHFTLIWEKIRGNWKIILDHTS